MSDLVGMQRRMRGIERMYRDDSGRPSAATLPTSNDGG